MEENRLGGHYVSRDTNEPITPCWTVTGGSISLACYIPEGTKNARVKEKEVLRTVMKEMSFLTQDIYDHKDSHITNFRWID